MNYLQFRDMMSPFPSFSVREIEKYDPDFDNRRLVEWQQKGYIKRIRNQWYMFSDQPGAEGFLYHTANQIYSPSYVSMESALSFHGFIPEGVFQVTSCTTLKTQRFDTPIGRFFYRRIKPVLFFGYKLIEWDKTNYKIAEPEKAIIDYMYLHSEVRQVKDIEALRWNRSHINETISPGRLDKYEKYINSSALSRRLNIVRGYLHAET